MMQHLANNNDYEKLHYVTKVFFTWEEEAKCAVEKSNENLAKRTKFEGIYSIRNNTP